MNDGVETLESLAAALSQRFGIAGTADAADLPSEPGAYLLLLTLPGEVPLDITAVRGRSLPSDHYLYAGSARGPGGLRARLARHLRREKKPHWHIDRLTVTAERIRAFPFPGAQECTLVETLLESGCYHHPLPGFGSSDCRTCASNLLAPT